MGFIPNIPEEIVKWYERRSYLMRLKEISDERWEHKLINSFVDNPFIQDYIDELDKEENVYNELLKKL